MTTTSLNSPKDHALRYHGEGFSVFILKNPDAPELAKDRKRPAVYWELYQIMRASKIQIERWYSKDPSYNLAAAMGNASKAIAIDVDGPTAVQRIKDKLSWMSSSLREALANTMKNRTGSGGEHIIFRMEDEKELEQVGSTTVWTDGKDHSEIKIKGNGGYIVMPPSRHPNGELYEWNGKELQAITKQELDEFVRLMSPKEQKQKLSIQQTDVVSERNNIPTTTTRPLSPEQMQELLSWIKPYYTPGTRDHIIFFISGMFRKDGGFPLSDARAFIELLCNESGYPDEDLDKSLQVVDNTYKKDSLESLSGKAGLHDLLVTSHESASRDEYLARAEAWGQICQIVNAEPGGPQPPPPGDDDNGPAGGPTDDDNNNYSGKWLSEIKQTYEDPKDCPVIALLTKEILKLERFRTLEDTKEILWYHKGVYRLGGEERIVSRLDELGGYGVNITIRREVTEYIKAKTFTDRDIFDKDPLILICKNGVVDLRTGERYAHDPDKYPSLIQIPHNYYTPEEMCRRILARPKENRILAKKTVWKFLYNVLDPSDARRGIESWGHDLIKDNKFLQKSTMCVGPPDTGKSTFLKITGALVGSKNISHKSLMQLIKNRFAVADLYGKLVNYCADISSSKLVNIEIFKLVASGDEISAEKKGRDPFTFRPFCKLKFSANTPPLPDEELDDAYYKRWILLVFNNIREKDFLNKEEDVIINRRLLEDIEQDENELDDLFYLAVQSAKRLVKNQGFSGGKRTEDIDTIREEYMRKAVPIKAWIEDNCVFGTDYLGEKADMFKDFNDYCRKENLPGVATVRALGMQILELHPNIKDHSVGKGKDKRHVWRGIKLTSKLTTAEQSQLFNNEIELGETSYE